MIKQLHHNRIGTGAGFSLPWSRARNGELYPFST